jgi:hypothetical protein
MDTLFIAVILIQQVVFNIGSSDMVTKEDKATLTRCSAEVTEIYRDFANIEVR